jgi:ATP-dependent RNA helicase DDX24/MAK5
VISDGLLLIFFYSFKANKTAVLVASDVAARGLDIPLVDHVIHYQLPRSGEIYVHRSGRTARANQDGVSLMLCSPEEVSLYKKLVLTLRNGNSSHLHDPSNSPTSKILTN